MSHDPLNQHIDALIHGTIMEAEHQWLQSRLQNDAAARKLFRERMDLEAGLRTWAADSDLEFCHNQNLGRGKGVRSQLCEAPVGPFRQLTPDPFTTSPPILNGDKALVPQLTARNALAGKRGRFASGWHIAWIALAASILSMVVWWTWTPERDLPQQAEQPAGQPAEALLPRPETTAPVLGKWVAQANGVWQQPPALADGRFKAGLLKLESGAAELRFDSGTIVVLEGPCELMVNTADSAQLLAGTVYVNVTEVSNGFLLATPESQIIDDGTQYAVSVDSETTEVHVFDGSVIWTSIDADADFEDRIATGESRRYLRSQPGRPRRIPFGQRQFVKRIDEQVRQAGGGELLAYDGFENLAGQIRRDRSGFGWSGGWESARAGRGPLGEVIAAPSDLVFGKDRSGRRLLSLQGGESLRRRFEEAIELRSDKTLFVSLLMTRQSASERAGEGQAGGIQVVLEPESASPRFTRRHSVSFGVTSDGRLFLNNSGTIDETATSLPIGEPHLFVLMYKADSSTTTAHLRVYRVGEPVDATQPTVWTVSGTPSNGPAKFVALRLSLGTRAAAQIDELRVSDSWKAAVDLAN
jgi:hypothetical protein